MSRVFSYASCTEKMGNEEVEGGEDNEFNAKVGDARDAGFNFFARQSCHP